ncbi:MAG: hypothetical protein LBV06_09165 [Propionibacteriaceae bacterium]|jgi:hypothetical protein|nr:hypothetical protein [Propionibacteriaceae bacterium]
MSIITLVSATGSPGVTTTAVGLACLWPSPAIVVEADPSGSSAMLAGYFGGFQPPPRTMIDLVMARRAGHLAEEFPAALMPLPNTRAQVLPGPRSHAQARSALDLWEALIPLWRLLGQATMTNSDRTTDADRTAVDSGETTSALPDVRTDFLVDAGRLGMQWSPEAVIRASDLVILMTRCDLPSLAGAQQWTAAADERRRGHPEAPEWMVVTVGPPEPYTPHEIATAVGLPILASLRHDPVGAAVYSHGRQARRRSPLRSDLTSLARSISDHLDERQRLLGGGARAGESPRPFSEPRSGPGGARAGESVDRRPFAAPPESVTPPRPPDPSDPTQTGGR